MIKASDLVRRKLPGSASTPQGNQRPTTLNPCQPVVYFSLPFSHYGPTFQNLASHVIPLHTPLSPAYRSFEAVCQD
jgi:hypothetical protein